jgi:hypothetical protein
MSNYHAGPAQISCAGTSKYLHALDKVIQSPDGQMLNNTSLDLLMTSGAYIFALIDPKSGELLAGLHMVIHDEGRAARLQGLIVPENHREKGYAKHVVAFAVADLAKMKRIYDFSAIVRLNKEGKPNPGSVKALEVGADFKLVGKVIAVQKSDDQIHAHLEKDFGPYYFVHPMSTGFDGVETANKYLRKLMQEGRA